MGDGLRILYAAVRYHCLRGRQNRKAAPPVLLTEDLTFCQAAEASILLFPYILERDSPGQRAL